MRVHLGALVRACGIVVAAIAVTTSVIRRHVLRTLALGLCLLVGSAWAATASYYYDELGRLVETVAADGTSVLYSYDAVGNITSVKHDAVSTVGISGFIPTSGPVGTSVTIFGSGFNTTAASNVVKFNGVAATVTTATATTLTVTVPTGATTGTLSVANGAANATSSLRFTVASSGAPTISSFTPTIGAWNTAVAISGINFQTTAATDKVLFGTIAAPVSTATATTITTLVPSPASSGKISVTTPFGVATSAGDFFDVPPGFNVANVQFTGRVTVGGAPLIATTTTTGKIGLILFDGVAGSNVNYLQLTNVTASGGSVTVFSPDGSQVVSGSVAHSVIELPRLPMTGTYTVVLAPAAATSVTVSLNQATALAVDGASVNITSADSGFGTYLSFQAAAGQNLGVGVSGVTFAGGAFGISQVSVIQPDGSTSTASALCYGNGSNCNLVLTNLPLGGTYLLRIYDSYQGNNYPAISGGTVTLSSDKTATLTSGTAYPLSLRSGQNGRLKFAGTAGQPATIRFENMTTTPANQNAAVTILKPDGTTLTTAVNGSSSTNGADIYVASLPTSGNYTVIVLPAAGAVTTMSITVNPVPELVVDGAAVNISTSAVGYGTSLSFNATAGQNLGVGISGVTFAGGDFAIAPVSVLQPDGSTSTASALCWGNGSNCNLVLTNLPTTGTYLLYIADNYQGSNYPPITGGTVTLSSDKTATLTSGTAYSLSLRSGQNGRLKFAGTAGQPATIRFENMTTTPANQNVAVTMLKPDGTTLTTAVNGSSSTNGSVIYVANLPTTGNYTVIVAPAAGAVTTMSMTFNPTPELVVDGSAVGISTSAAGYGTSLSFNATAGQNLGVGISGVTFAGGDFAIAPVSVLQPDGSTSTASALCWGNGSNCNLVLTNLPLTGAYLLRIADNYQGSNYPPINGGTVTLSSDKTATLTSGTAYSLSLRSGQNGRLTFAGTAVAHSLTVGAPTTVPSGQTVSISVLDSSNNTVASGSYSAGAVLALGTLNTSTYTVLVNPQYVGALTMMLTYQ